MKRFALTMSFAACLMFVPGAGAQTTIPVRALTPAVSTDSGLLRSVTSIRPLSDGRVIVNDQSRRRVLLFESDFVKYAVVMDSGAGAHAYGVQIMDLVPYLADTTLFFDVDSKVFVVVSPAGVVARAMAPPRALQTTLDLAMFSASARRMRVDPQGRFIMQVIRSSAPPSPSAVPPDSGMKTVNFRQDSVAVIRLDPDTKAVDTLAMVANATAKSVTIHLGRGGSSGGSGTNPYPNPDEWVFLPDGTIAVVRGHDYHIDWNLPNGTKTSSPKMPFDWKRIPDDEKQRLSDSLRKSAEDRFNGPAPTSSLGGITRTIPRAPPVWFEPSEIAEYYPPIRSNTVRTDPEGNVWVLPTTSMLAGQGLVYDVVNRKGEIVERVRLPEGRNLVAIGPGGFVYMSYTPRGAAPRLERARVIR